MEQTERSELIKQIISRTGINESSVRCVLRGDWHKKVSKRNAALIINVAKAVNLPFEKPPEEPVLAPLPSLPKLTDDEYPDPADSVEDQMRFLLGDEDFIRLVENFAGMRLFIPSSLERSKLPELLGVRAVSRLSQAYPGGYIRVPMAREFRAEIYRKQGLSNRQAAVKLGMTESGMQRMITRLRQRGEL